MGTVHKLTITCPLYCEDLIERETEQWGLSVEKVHHGAVSIRGRLEDAYTVCLRSRVANRVRNWLTHETIRDSACGLKVFKRECVARVKMFNGMHRFLPTLARMEGYRVAEIAVSHRPR